MKKNKNKSDDIYGIKDDDYLAAAASARDCTGLIQTPPQNEAENANYEALYPFLPPEPPKDVED